jgi:hypothetical protein
MTRMGMMITETEKRTSRQQAIVDYNALADWQYALLLESPKIAHLRISYLHYADLWIRMIITATSLPGERDLPPALV